MEEKKSNSGIVLNQRNFYHKILMTCILKQLSDTPLVLKGGDSSLCRMLSLDNFIEGYVQNEYFFRIY